MLEQNKEMLDVDNCKITKNRSAKYTALCPTYQIQLVTFYSSK